MSEASARIRVSINGELHALPETTTVAGLLDQLGLDRRKVAVERNEAIVIRSAYDNTPIEPDDRLEIVHFIGGG